MSHRISRARIGFLAGVSLVPLMAYSQVYLTEEQVGEAFFPGAKLKRKLLELTSEEIKKITDKSGERVRNGSIILWHDEKKDLVFIDQVLGKHEFITYAVGISPDGAVKGIEIIEYRETFGHEVRNPEWRKQFIGKNSNSPLKLNKDIANISGATLSSAHISAGVRRVLQTYEAIRDRI